MIVDCVAILILKVPNILTFGKYTMMSHACIILSGYPLSIMNYFFDVFPNGFCHLYKYILPSFVEKQKISLFWTEHELSQVQVPRGLPTCLECLAMIRYPETKRR